MKTHEKITQNTKKGINIYMLLKDSQTKINLMKAFAGESQAANRYLFAAKQAKKENLYILQEIFTFTANQEKAHAKVFFDHLKSTCCENVDITAGYPVDLSKDVLGLLESAAHNENEEYEIVYKEFAKVAMEEGFPKIAESFSLIAEIEKVHRNRFDCYHGALNNHELFNSSGEDWMCLHCGHVAKGATEAPKACPVCSHNQGYFARANQAPYTWPERMIGQ